jgi:kumamolisin
MGFGASATDGILVGRSFSQQKFQPKESSMTTSSRFAAQHRVILPGSEKEPFTAEAIPARATAAKAATERGQITVSLILAPKTPFTMPPDGVPERLTREEFASRHGADPASVALVSAFAQEFGLTVDPVQAGPCTVQLSGSVDAMEKAFGVSLKTATADAGTFRVREGGIYLPEELQGHVLAVLGLDNRPQARPPFRIALPDAVNVSYTPVQVGALYFPRGQRPAGRRSG